VLRRYTYIYIPIHIYTYTYTYTSIYIYIIHIYIIHIYILEPSIPSGQCGGGVLRRTPLRHGGGESEKWVSKPVCQIIGPE